MIKPTVISWDMKVRDDQKDEINENYCLTRMK